MLPYAPPPSPPLPLLLSDLPLLALPRWRGIRRRRTVRSPPVSDAAARNSAATRRDRGARGASGWGHIALTLRKPNHQRLAGPTNMVRRALYGTPGSAGLTGTRVMALRQLGPLLGKPASQPDATAQSYLASAAGSTKFGATDGRRAIVARNSGRRQNASTSSPARPSRALPPPTAPRPSPRPTSTGSGISGSGHRLIGQLS